MSTPASAEPVPPTRAAAASTTGPVTDIGVAADPPAAPEAPCANCGARLAGNYCSACGQRHEHEVHSFSHFLREATEDLTHADSRLWRTIVPLLIRPGFLTREFLDGRRIRYLPPVRLYLVLSVFFFLIAAMIPPQSATRHMRLMDVSGSSVRLAPFGAAPGSRPVDAARAQQVCARFSYQGPLASRLAPRIAGSCAELLQDGGRKLYESLLHNAGRAMFLLLPLLALVMKGLYRRPSRLYVEHLLFFVHNHACLFLVLGVYELLVAFGPVALHPTLHILLWIYVPVYLYTSMLRVYRQRWLITAAKFAALYCAYWVLGVMMLTVMTAYSFLTL